MNIKQLKVFKEVCEEMSFTRASEKLYMTQPAVSHSINELEKEIGCRLFDRLSRKIYLTGAGEVLRDRTIHLLEAYDDIHKGLTDAENTRPLRIGSSITIANIWLPDIVSRFNNRCPKSRINVSINRAEKIEDMLTSGKIDIGLIEGVVNHESLIITSFNSYDIALVCAPEHRLASVGRVVPEELLREDLILREKGSAIRDTFDSAMRLKGLQVTPTWTGINSQALIQAVKHNLGMTVMPLILVEDKIASGGLICVDIEGVRLSNKTYVAYHCDKYLTEPMQIFVDSVKE